MEDILKIGMFQFDLAWENPLENIQKIEHALQFEAEQLNVLLLPEMFNTGFSMDVEKNGETMSGPTLTWMKKVSFKYDIVIIGTIIIQVAKKFYNRCLVVYPTGKILSYDKRHLFSYGKEDRAFTAGNNKLVVDVNGWKICPLICYDLRFPAWSRNNDEYDVLVYMANWPSPRALAWKSLLRARAIENLSYAIGVNRIGTDENGLVYQGDSLCIDFEGNIKINLQDQELLKVVEIHKDSLVSYRAKYKFHNDRDKIQIID